MTSLEETSQMGNDTDEIVDVAHEAAEGAEDWIVNAAALANLPFSVPLPAFLS